MQWISWFKDIRSCLSISSESMPWRVHRQPKRPTLTSIVIRLLIWQNFLKWWETMEWASRWWARMLFQSYWEQLISIIRRGLIWVSLIIMDSYNMFSKHQTTYTRMRNVQKIFNNWSLILHLLQVKKAKLCPYLRILVGFRIWVSIRKKGSKKLNQDWIRVERIICYLQDMYW